MIELPLVLKVLAWVCAVAIGFGPAIIILIVLGFVLYFIYAVIFDWVVKLRGKWRRRKNQKPLDKNRNLA